MPKPIKNQRLNFKKNFCIIVYSLKLEPVYSKIIIIHLFVHVLPNKVVVKTRKQNKYQKLIINQNLIAYDPIHLFLFTLTKSF